MEVAGRCPGHELLDYLREGMLGLGEPALYVNDDERGLRRVNRDRRLVFDAQELLDFLVVVHGSSLCFFGPTGIEPGFPICLPRTRGYYRLGGGMTPSCIIIPNMSIRIRVEMIFSPANRSITMPHTLIGRC